MSLQIEQKDYKQQFLTLFVIFIEDNLIVQRLLFFKLHSLYFCFYKL